MQGGAFSKKFGIFGSYIEERWPECRNLFLSKICPFRVTAGHSLPRKMALAKRKAENGADRDANKRPKSDKSKSSSKEKTTQPEKPMPKPADKASSKSILSKEQPAFPRGGASLLTPLEKKQINAQAWRDAQKEDGTTTDLFAASDADSDGSSVNRTGIESQTKSKTLKVKGEKSKKVGASKPKDTKIGGLSHKRMAVGSLILGQITSITDRDLTVGLPNGLSGRVVITAVSSELTTRLQKILEEKEGNGSATDEEDDEFDLHDYFVIGQYVRVSVTSTGQDATISSAHAKKHVDLSLDPTLVNLGLTKSALARGVTVQVSVQSIEDHGLIVNLGLGDDVRGFVPAKNLPPGKTLGEIKTGAVILCQVAQADANSKVIRLSADLSDQRAVKVAPSVDAYLPGTVAEILLTEVQPTGLVGKIMGMLTVTADLVQSGAFLDKEAFVGNFKVGKKINARLICNFPASDVKRLAFSTRDHVLSLEDAVESGLSAIGETILSAKVITVEAGLGTYLDLGDGRTGFAHISRLFDGRVESIEATIGPFKVGSQHKARIIGYDTVDRMFLISLQDSVLRQLYLRLEDVPVGEVVKPVIEKVLIGPAGIRGLIVKINETISGFIPEQHLSDVTLEHQEKKFREGASVKARVLSVDLEKRQIRLTAKKTLVNSDANIWKSYSDIAVGHSTVGMLVKIDPHGGLVQFYGDVKGFLPVAEMSEAYIKDAREHFRVGQVVTVNAISVDSGNRRLTVSCRDSSATDQSSDAVLDSLEPGALVNGTVFEKSENDLLLRLEESSAIARLSIDHVADGSLKKRQSALNKIRVGQKLEGLLILDVQAKRRLVVLCNRPGLIKAAEQGKLLKSFEDLHVGSPVTGFISNITPAGVYVSFASRISGLVTSRNVAEGQEESPDFGMTKLQTVTAKISSVDYKGATPRFWLTMRESAHQVDAGADTAVSASSTLVDPVDVNIKSEADLAVNVVTKARVLSVKESQLNVELAKSVQGRIDVSEVFDRWEDIKDRKRPLQKFAPKQIVSVKVLGAHDTRNHRFLPLSHRRGKNVVYELSMKPSVLSSNTLQPLAYESLKVGDSHVAFVNNLGSDTVWANISPGIRGRIKTTNISDDLSLATNLMTNFPIGSALRVKVLSVDVGKGRLDLSGKLSETQQSLAMEDVSVGQILTGRVTKITDRSIVVSLSDSMAGVIDLLDLADDYTEADPAKLQKNDIIRVCVVRVDRANKKISLSARPSRILSSSLPVADPEVNDINKLKVNDVYRGFIRNVDDKGIFISLGHGLTAFVRVSQLSDAFLKAWKNDFQRDQLVRGKIISIDQSSGHIQMSLKGSVLEHDYTPPLRLTDLKIGDVVTGKVGKVEEFGVFIVADNSEKKIRGLCHRSEIAENRIQDARKLFKEGDAVKAKVLKIELDKSRINFGLKASYFQAEDEDVTADSLADSDLEMEDEADQGSDEVNGGPDEMALDDTSGNEDGGAELDGLSEDDISSASLSGGSADVESEEQDKVTPTSSSSLKVGGFDWHGMPSKAVGKQSGTEPDDEEGKATEKPKKRKRKAEIQVDRTGDLDANGPQSADDFERLLLGEPDSSLLWLQYMAFNINLGDIDQARQLGERALKSIGLGQDTEKQNIWVALLNLEAEYGDEETLNSTFRRACEYNDPQEMHSRLTSILIHTQKLDRADAMFQTMLKKYTQDPKVWTNYATFLLDTKGDAERARELLPRALQTLPKFTHLDLTSKFAQLEFKSEAGLAERGRTIFEGLVNSFPKRIDLYNVLLDLEEKVGDEAQIRGLFERIFTRKLKPKQAKYFFKRWLAFEQQKGDERKIEEVKAKAATWIRSAGSKE